MTKENLISVRVSVKFPWLNDAIHYEYFFSRALAEDAVYPLPSDREMDPFCALRAQEQLAKRRGIIDMLSQQIANAIIQACSSQDPDHGYDKKVKP